jgi:hypothetical protein
MFEPGPSGSLTGSSQNDLVEKKFQEHPRRPFMETPLTQGIFRISICNMLKFSVQPLGLMTIALHVTYMTKGNIYFYREGLVTCEFLAPG